jgi:serine-type D-Ala-D-Ala carboxypeptidase (penicillin-binding protein 5/6)
MKLFAYLFFFLSLAFSSHLQAQASGSLGFRVKADAYILMDAKSGKVLAEKKSDKQYFPASITKVATALYALKKEAFLDHMVLARRAELGAISPQEKVKSHYKLPSYWIEFASSHIGLKVGEKVPFRDLYYGMMLESGNDAANVIAAFVSGSVPKFIEELNVYLKDLGCRNTNFNNPHGLHHPEHVTTAYDLALITKESLKNPFFRKVVSSLKYTKGKTNKQNSTGFFQSNRLLKRGKYYYPKAIGVKAGYTIITKHTFIAAAEDNGRELICVLLKNKKAKDNYLDAINLFEHGFKEEKKEKLLFTKGKQEKLILDLTAFDKKVPVYLKDDVSVLTYSSHNPLIKAFVNWHSLTLPVEKDQMVGELFIKNQENKILSSAPLFALERVDTTLKQKISNIDFWAKANHSLIFSVLFMMVLFSLKMRIASKY